MEDRQPMRVIKRSDRSTRMHLLHLLVRPFRPSLVKPGKPLPAGSPRLTPPSKAKKQCQITERKVNDIYIYDFNPQPSGSTSPAKRIYYFAGGGWQSPPSSQHWSLLLSLHQSLPNTTISLVSYPLAPNTPAATSLPQLQALYATLLDQSHSTNETVILAGDSSGGNIALSLILHACSTLNSQSQSPVPIPSAVLFISPAVDLRPKDASNPGRTMAATAKSDPILTVPFINGTAAAWTSGSEELSNDPLISPVNADVIMLAKAGVKVYGLTGGIDVLTPDALVFRDRCVAAGVQGEWLEWERQMHCFPLAWVYGLPESKEGKNWIIEKLQHVKSPRNGHAD